MSHKTSRPPQSECKKRMTITEHLERLYEWQSYPGKISGGKMEVFVHGHWISLEEFNQHFPKPQVNSFIPRRENIDSTTSWKD